MKSVVLVLSLMCAGVLANSEHDLARHLLDNYPSPKFVRPAQNHTDAVPLEIAFYLINIANIDEANGLLTVTGYLYLSWWDPYLMWTPDEHDGITSLNYDSASIWVPDIRGYQSVKEISDPELAIILSEGQVYYERTATYEVQCTHDCETEIYTCKLIFGSWTYHSGQVDLSIAYKTDYSAIGPGIVTDFLQDGPKWELVNTSAVIESTKYPCCPDLYQSLHGTLQIRKKAGAGHHNGDHHDSHKDHHSDHHASHEGHHGNQHASHERHHGNQHASHEVHHGDHLHAPHEGHHGDHHASHEGHHGNQHASHEGHHGDHHHASHEGHHGDHHASHEGHHGDNEGHASHEGHRAGEPAPHVDSHEDSHENHHRH